MPAIAISPQRRDEILDALRCGTVPATSLDILAVGLDPFEAILRAEHDSLRTGRGMFKAVRGEYGSGKTFFARWVEELARHEGFATSEVQISETETPAEKDFSAKSPQNLQQISKLGAAWRRIFVISLMARERP